MHQIWIGKKKPPVWIDTCKRMAEESGWTHMLWTEQKIYEELGTSWGTYPQYKKRLDYIGRADIVRYEILAKHGGVYFDADSACLRPIDWLQMNVDTECWLSEEYRKWSKYVANGFIGCVPGSKLMDVLNTEIAKYDNINKDQAWIMVGPKFVNVQIQKLGVDGDPAMKTGKMLDGAQKLSVTIVPYCFFLPDHWYDLQKVHLRDRHVAKTQALKLHEILEDFAEEYSHSYTYQFWGSTFGTYQGTDVKPREDVNGAMWRTDFRCGGKIEVPNPNDTRTMVVHTCDPESDYPCCSPQGWCGDSLAHCECENGCVDYRQYKKAPEAAFSGGQASSS